MYFVGLTDRTAVCGPACTVVWQGRVGDHSPYADLRSVPGVGNAGLLSVVPPGQSRAGVRMEIGLALAVA
jgi:hypothetical protein